MSKQFTWVRDNHGAGWRADMPANITLVAYPDQTTGLFGDKSRRSTTWRSQASQWDEATSCCSCYGREGYGVRHASAKDAMRAAEAIYLEAAQ